MSSVMFWESDSKSLIIISSFKFQSWVMLYALPTMNINCTCDIVSMPLESTWNRRQPQHTAMKGTVWWLIWAIVNKQWEILLTLSSAWFHLSFMYERSSIHACVWSKGGGRGRGTFLRYHQSRQKVYQQTTQSLLEPSRQKSRDVINQWNISRPTVQQSGQAINMQVTCMIKEMYHKLFTKNSVYATLP